MRAHGRPSLFLPLMGVLIAVAWMLLLGAIMAAEKNLTWGRRLSAPLGGGLIAAATLIVADGLGIVSV